MEKIPYREVAKSALMAWYREPLEAYGAQVSKSVEDLATELAYSKTIEDLETGNNIDISDVYGVDAKDSITAGTTKIAQLFGLNTMDATQFAKSIMSGNSPKNDAIFRLVASKTSSVGDVEDLVLQALAAIHDNWVMKNSNEKNFNKKVNRKQLRQYNPLELIGWNETKSDLVFLKPVLEAIGITIDETKLEEKYHEWVKNYMTEMKITNQDDLTILIEQGNNFYPALPEELSRRLKPRAAEVSAQIISNWEENDKKSAIIFMENARKAVIASDAPTLK